MRLDLADRQTVEVGEEGGDGVAVERRGHAGGLVEDAGQVQLDAVAGAEDDGLAVEAAGERVEGGGQLVVAERQPFADGDGRGAVAAADGEEDHDGPPVG